MPQTNYFSALGVALAGLVGGCGLLGKNHPGAEAQQPPVNAGGSAGATAGSAGAAGVGGAVPPSAHGVVPMHALRVTEYKNTVRDLLGVEPTALGFSDATPPYAATIPNVEPWFEAATQAAAALFQQQPLPQPFACASSGGDARACALGVIDDFGLRAFRRPLRDEEQQAYAALYDKVIALGRSNLVAVEQIVRAMLVSPQLAFHIELSDQPDGTAAEPLDSYALAARLSYALWSTTPDPVLLQAAAQDLTSDAALDAAYTRLSESPRAVALADGLGEVWLGLSRLADHSVEPALGVSLSPALRQAMLGEQREFLRVFLTEPQPLKSLLTLDVNFVDDTLAAHYGFEPVGPNLTRVSVTTDQRVGLLGLAGFLTLTSRQARTSPTARGVYVLSRLLCSPPPPDQPSTQLGDDTGAPPADAPIRVQLEWATKEPTCHACHAQFDPFGFALGHFDALGHYIASEGGVPVDSSATLSPRLFPAGVSVNGLPELASALAEHPLFHACAARNLAKYMIHREITEETDADLLDPLGRSVTALATLPALSKTIALSDAFRYRRQPPSPL